MIVPRPFKFRKSGRARLRLSFYKFKTGEFYSGLLFCRTLFENMYNEKRSRVERTSHEHADLTQ